MAVAKEDVVSTEFFARRRTGISSRTRRLKDSLISKSFMGDKFKEPVFIDPEKARLYTESWKTTEGLPTVLRRAKAFEHILDHCAVVILENELIVGYPGSGTAALLYSPERPRRIVEELIDHGYVRDEDKAEVLELADYWAGKTPRDMMARYFSTEEMAILNSRRLIWALGADYTQRAMPDHDYVFAHGLEGIINKLQMAMDQVQVEMVAVENLVRLPELAQKRDFYEAAIISCRAAIRWARRHAQLARYLAGREADPVRQLELEGIAEVCDHVPARPPKTFQEAVQAHYFIWLLTHFYDHECHGTSERIDQILWPAYRSSVIENREINREQAQELLECLWIKITSCGRLLPSDTRQSHQGTNMVNAYTIGGQLADGTDACNELTEVILDATSSIRVNQPSLAFRYHSHASEAAVLKALQVIQTGMGMPSFKNDDVAIPSLMDMGYTLKEARDWALIGCMSPGVVGRWGRVRRNAWHITVTKSLEAALNDGRDMLNGLRLGPETGDPSTFASYEDLLKAFREQVRYALRLGMRMHNISLWLQAEYFPRPFLSALFERSIEHGRDLMGTGDKSVPWINILGGAVDTADALAALKKLVFEEKVIDLPSLVEILRNDWEGHEDLRQRFLNAPKFGNDDDYVDTVAARDLYGLVIEEMSQLRDTWGVTPKCLPQAVSGVWSMGKVTAALPNGRHKGDPLADGGISPNIGSDHNGPTAVLASVAKIDHLAHKAILLNQRFTPSAFAGDKGKRNFLAYMKTWHDYQIDHVQFNMVDSATLRKAQLEPEKHRDIMVRVAGYSAYFVELDQGVQDHIIARTGQEL
ncbi:MAG TPA: pyruvate formate lyase family protein [Bacillota bacterium]